MAVFGRVSDAVAAAVDVHAGIRTRALAHVGQVLVSNVTPA